MCKLQFSIHSIITFKYSMSNRIIYWAFHCCATSTMEFLSTLAILRLTQQQQLETPYRMGFAPSSWRRKEQHQNYGLSVWLCRIFSFARGGNYTHGSWLAFKFNTVCATQKLLFRFHGYCSLVITISDCRANKKREGYYFTTILLYFIAITSKERK